MRGAEVVLAEIREVSIGDEKTEEPFYFSYWVVPKDSPYASLEDLRGKKVAFPSQLSTSGYVAPLARLVELGLVEQPEEGNAADPSDFFGEVIYAGGYSQAWEALKAGQVDVAIIAGDVPADLYDEVLVRDDGARRARTDPVTRGRLQQGPGRPAAHGPEGGAAGARRRRSTGN